METVQTDIVWVLPLFLGALLLLASAFAWWRVGNGKVIEGRRLLPSDSDLRQAANLSALAFGLLAIALLALFWTRI